MLTFAMKETRGDCPACGYPNTYSETIGKNGRRIGWCASCQDKEAIRAHLRGAGGDDRRAVGRRAIDSEKATREAEKRTQAAAAIWSGAAPVTARDPAGKYLVRRGLGHLIGNPALRYREDMAHPYERGSYHALVAAVQSAAGGLVAVHRTYLTPDGVKACLDVAKASKGPVAGGAIRLAPAAPEIIIGEGIESAASAGLLLGLPAWAAISAGNLATGLILPPEVRSVVIAADDDGVNRQGRNPGIEAAKAAAARWQAERRSVRIIKPEKPGTDFNDILQAREAGKAVAG